MCMNHTSAVASHWHKVLSGPSNRLERVLALRGCIIGIGASNFRAPYAPYEIVAISLNTFPGSSILSDALYDLVAYNTLHDEPLMSSTVISVGENGLGMPSEGYWTALKDLIGIAPISPIDRQECWWKEFYSVRLWMKSQLSQSTRNTSGVLV